MKYLISVAVSLLLFVSCNCIGLTKSIKSVISENTTSVVMVGFEHGHCTGFVVSKDVIMTAGHCIDDLQHQLKVLDSTGTEHVAIPFFDDDELDLGLLYVLNLKLPPLPLATKEPIIGERLMVIGFPGYAQGSKMFEVGYLKGFMRTPKRNFLISDNMLFRGESGGPVFDETGLVVGVAVGIKPLIDVIDQTIMYQYKDLAYIVSIVDVLSVLGE